jgi:hypothetical protein
VRADDKHCALLRLRRRRLHEHDVLCWHGLQAGVWREARVWLQDRRLLHHVRLHVLGQRRLLLQDGVWLLQDSHGCWGLLAGRAGCHAAAHARQHVWCEVAVPELAQLAEALPLLGHGAVPHAAKHLRSRGIVQVYVQQLVNCEWERQHR